MVHVKKIAMCALVYSGEYMAIFHADTCRLKCSGIPWQNQQSCNKEDFYTQTFPWIVFSNVCTFENTFESSRDVRAECKLVDISYRGFSTKTSWN